MKQKFLKTGRTIDLNWIVGHIYATRACLSVSQLDLEHALSLAAKFI